MSHMSLRRGRFRLLFSPLPFRVRFMCGDWPLSGQHRASDTRLVRSSTSYLKWTRSTGSPTNQLKPFTLQHVLLSINFVSQQLYHQHHHYSNLHSMTNGSNATSTNSVVMTKHNECIRVNATKVAEGFIEELRAILSLFEGEFRPKLVGYLANNDASALTYAQWTAKSCQSLGIDFELIRVKREQLEDTLLKANEDDNINGIMVYYPVFGGGHDQYIQSCLSAYKDVEGLCHLYRFNMYHNIRYLDEQRTLKCIIPCTPLAMIKILEHLDVYDRSLEIGDQLKGKTITIVNRSEVVGRPLAALLANDGAKVYSVDVNDVLEFHRGDKQMKHYVSDTHYALDDVLPRSDVVITGVPGQAFKIATHKLKKGVIAINFSSQNNFTEDVVDRARMYVPSIGKVTIAMLQRNLLRLYNYQLQHRACSDMNALHQQHSHHQ